MNRPEGMSDELVEGVARDLAEYDGKDWEAMDEAQKDDYRDLAEGQDA